MSSWASIAKSQPTHAADSSSVSLTAKEGLRLLVVDANAIIDGVKLEGVADKVVTIQEVLDEIKDKQSRQYLANLPYDLELSEPSEVSIQAVTRFARATGDISALSRVDIKLVALAHTLEVAAHGCSHLLTHPHQPRMHSTASFASEDLPGWGSVANPSDWKAVDEANDADEAALMAASTSRIAQHVQQLTLDPADTNTFLQDAPADATGGSSRAESVAAPLTPEAAGIGSQHQQQRHAAQQHDFVAHSCSADVQGSAVDEDVWEVAASSKGAARHRKRKAIKRQQQHHAIEQEWAEQPCLVEEQQQQQQSQEQQQQHQANPSEQHYQDNAMAAADPALQDSTPEQQDSTARQWSEAPYGKMAEDVTNEELLRRQHCMYTANDAEAAVGDENQHGEQQHSCSPGGPGWQSSVAIITGDFAMQNVLLQMGMRLITKDGRRIARLTRYALRCSACFTVTREPGRLFCPKCGNLSLDRVEVVVGPDGAEFFGISKRHILRGTRFSLPKPKGGRAAEEHVLREDVFLQKVKALGKQAMKKKAADADDIDAFAPEYSQDTWHAPSQQELAQYKGLAAVLQPPWKHNPNERRLTRSNRRG